MNYNEAINYIKNTAKFGMKLGLERTEKILELLGNPHKKVDTIHVAGTNGKGSITSMITNILINSGYKVGCYISPYIEVFEERMQINNCNIDKEELARIITEVSKAVDQVEAMGYGNPTEFEIITCAGFLYFYEMKVDYVVVEVGLGGRLDSTNVITPKLSVISSISLDHVNILGDTIEEIAYEKAGIIKNNVDVVLYPQQESVEKVIRQVCTERGSNLFPVKQENANLKKIVTDSHGKVVQQIEVRTERDDYEVMLPLLGVHQIQNCNVVINVCERLMEKGIKITKAAMLKGIGTVRWPGRMEIMKTSPFVVLDGAHNIDGIRFLKRSIETYFKYDKLILVLGILADKQVDEMIREICPMADHIIAVTPHSDRAELGRELCDKVQEVNENCEYIEDYEEAYNRALSLCDGDSLIVLSGSLYMVGDMRKIIRK